MPRAIPALAPAAATPLLQRSAALAESLLQEPDESDTNGRSQQLVPHDSSVEVPLHSPAPAPHLGAESESAEVMSWLATHSLQMYTDLIVEAGYSRMLFLSTITEEEVQEVVDLCKMKRPHARVFRTALSQLRPEPTKTDTPVVVQAEPVHSPTTALSAPAAAATEMAAQPGMTRASRVPHRAAAQSHSPRAHIELLRDSDDSKMCCGSRSRYLLCGSVMRPFNEWVTASQARFACLIAGMSVWFFGVVAYMCMSNSAILYFW